jgi:hypothetical protein
VAVRPGAGTSGASRIELTWPEGEIQNTWLQVILRGNDATGGFHTGTGLTASDVFYFGHRQGEAEFGDPAFALADANDEILVRNRQGPVASLGNAYDFNRDGFVDASDEIIVRFNQGFLVKIDIGGSPAAPEGSGGESDAPEASAVASALAARAGGARLRDGLPWQRDFERAVDRALGELGDCAALDEELLARLAARLRFARLPIVGHPQDGGAVETG